VLVAGAGTGLNANGGAIAMGWVLTHATFHPRSAGFPLLHSSLLLAPGLVPATHISRVDCLLLVSFGAGERPFFWVVGSERTFPASRRRRATLPFYQKAASFVCSDIGEASEPE
jgi:hypothetical protein